MDSEVDVNDTPGNSADTLPTPFAVIAAFIQRYRIPLAVLICVLVRLSRYALDGMFVPASGFTTSYLMTVSSIQLAIQLLAVAALGWPWTEFPVARRLALASGSTLALIVPVNVLMSAEHLSPGMIYWFIPLCMVLAFVAYGLVSLALMSGFVYIRMRYWPLYPPGHCIQCGYNLTGNVSGTCPECGNVMSNDGGVDVVS